MVRGARLCPLEFRFRSEKCIQAKQSKKSKKATEGSCGFKPSWFLTSKTTQTLKHVRHTSQKRKTKVYNTYHSLWNAGGMNARMTWVFFFSNLSFFQAENVLEANSGPTRVLHGERQTQERRKKENKKKRGKFWPLLLGRNVKTCEGMLETEQNLFFWLGWWLLSLRVPSIGRRQSNKRVQAEQKPSKKRPERSPVTQWTAGGKEEKERRPAI